MKIVVITPIPTPYRDPCWEVVAQQPDVDLTVIYCAAGKDDRPWQTDSDAFTYKRIFPRERNLLRTIGWGNSCYWNSEIKQLLKTVAPDVVLVGGYNHLTMLAAVQYCRKNGIPWILMCESWKRRTGIVGKLKQSLLKSWLKSAAGVMPTGVRASANAESLGVPLEAQCRFPNVPDIAALGRQSQELQARRHEIKSQLGIPRGNKLLVFAARMIPKKRPHLVVEAFLKLQKRGLSLAMIGDGPLKSDVEVMVDASDCANQIVFPGFLKPDEVHKWMAVADLYLQPSIETWGVAPIEALASGTPVVLSNDIGCVADVLCSPIVGRILESPDAEQLSGLLNQWLDELPSYADVTVAWQPWAQENTYHPLADRLTNFLKQQVLRSDKR